VPHKAGDVNNGKNDPLIGQQLFTLSYPSKSAFGAGYMEALAENLNQCAQPSEFK